MKGRDRDTFHTPEPGPKHVIVSLSLKLILYLFICMQMVYLLFLIIEKNMRRKEKPNVATPKRKQTEIIDFTDDE